MQFSYLSDLGWLRGEGEGGHKVMKIMMKQNY